MAIWKVTYFFERQQAASGSGDMGGGACVGWTETWYRDFSETNIEQIIAKVKVSDAADPFNYLVARMPLMPSSYICSYVRVSSPDGPRPLVKAANVGVSGTSTANTAAQTTCAVLIDFTAIVAAAGDTPGHSHRRPFFLRALPSTVINGDVFTPTAGFRGLLETYLSMLTATAAHLGGATPYRIRYRNTSANPWVPINSLVIGASPNTIDVTWAATPALGGTPTVGSRMMTRQIGSPLGANRAWKVINIPVAPATAYTLGRTRKPLAGDWNNLGQIRLSSVSYAPPTNWLVVGLRSRKLGRPSHPFRGRRSAA